MTNTRPDHSTVLAAIELANRAPSVHNSQPWRWLVGNSSVHLMAHHPRHVPATVPDLLLSRGAALHHLRVAFAALGWRTIVHRIPNQNDLDHLAAVETRPYAPTDDDVALAGAIIRRRTDRRGFTSWDVPTECLDRMVRDAAEAGALLVPVTDSAARWQLARAIDTAARQQAGLPDHELELVSRSGGQPVWHDAFPRGTLADEQDGGQLLVLAALDSDPASVLRAGEAASAAMLTATDAGLATCALSRPLEVADTRAAIRDQVLAGATDPRLILRVGRAPSSAPPQSPVRRTEDTVDYLPGTHKR